MTLTEAEYLRLYGHAVDELKPALPPARAEFQYAVLMGNFDRREPWLTEWEPISMFLWVVLSNPLCTKLTELASILIYYIQAINNFKSLRSKTEKLISNP